MKRLRIETPTGVKIIVLRDESRVPRAHDDLVAVILSKCPPRMAAWAAEAVLCLKFVDAQHGGLVHLDDDDDLAVMWDAGDSHVIRCEFEQADATNSHRLWSPERIALQLEAIENAATLARLRARASEAAPTPPPSLSETRGEAISPQPSAPSSGSHSRADAPSSPSDDYESRGDAPSVLSDYTRTRDTRSMDTDRSQLTRSDSLLAHGGSVRGSADWADPSIHSASMVRSSSVRSTLTLGPEAYQGDTLNVKVGVKTYAFPLVWLASSSDNVGEIMGPVAKPEWKVQREWSYKQVRTSDGQLAISYEPQVGSMKKMFSASTRFKFTVFFATARLYFAARKRFPSTISNLSTSSFVLSLVHQLLPTVTEWACVRPPNEYLDEHPQAGTEYQVVYVVREAREPLDAACTERVYWFLKTNLIAGEWADEKAKKGYAW